MFRGKYLAGMLAAATIIFAIGFYLPISAAMHIGIAVLLFIIFSVSVLVGNGRVIFDKRRMITLLLAAALFAFSFVYSERFLERTEGMLSSLTDGENRQISATVEDICYEKSYGSAYVLKDLSIEGETLCFDAMLEIPFAGGLVVGDTITFAGDVERITNGYENYRRSQGILASFSVENFVRTGSTPITISLFTRIREKISVIFETNIGDGAGYATALLLGDRTGLDGQTELAYHRLGISHVLAVSGMHFSVIVGGVDLLLRVLTVSRKKKNLFLILFSLFFALVCGFSASVARAVMMFCIYYFADSMGEKSDSLTSLFFATGCIVAVNPWTVYDAGLWLSVFSTLGIIAVMPAMKGILEKNREEHIAARLCKKALRGFLCMILMNLTAIFFTMPIVYFLYGGISLISPFANMIFIPLTELLLYLLIILTLLGFVPFLAPFLGQICGVLIDFADRLALSLSDVRGIFISIRYPFAPVILMVLILGISTVLFAREFRLRRMLAIFFGVTISFGICFFAYHHMGKDSSYVYLKTDGENDVVTWVDDGEALLVDVTNGSRRVPVMAIDALSSYYRCEIDTYALTHLHAYHAGTLKALAEEIKIHRILLPVAETEKDVEYANAILAALDGAVDVVFYKRDGLQTVSVGDTTLTLPSYKTISRSTHPVIVFCAETEGIGAFIYCGSSSMESPALWQEVMRYRTVILGAHGPMVKNIFDDTCLSAAELVLFTSSETLALTDMERINGTMALVDDEYHIRFDH